MHTRTLVIMLVSLSVPVIQTQADETSLAPDTTLEELLDMTVSTASRHEQTVRDAPSSVTIVTATEIERYGYRTLAEVLGNARGFYVTDDRNYTYAGTRGFSRPTDYNNRFLTMINGVSMNEPIWGAVPIGEGLSIPMDAVERIEIIRGPGSALYGTNAMFAVVNVITKIGNGVDGLQAFVNRGNFDMGQGTLLYGREFASGLDISFAGEWKNRNGVDLYFPEYDDPATNNGIAENLDWEKSVGTVGRVTYGPWSIQGVTTARRTGIATGSYETDFNDSRGQSLDKLNMQEIRFEQNPADQSQLMLRAIHKMYTYEGSWIYEGSDAPDEATTHSVVIEGQYRRDLSSTNRLIVGAEYVNHYESVYRYEDANFDQDRPYSVASAFVQNEHRPTPKVILSLGARLDRYSTVGNALTPRAAVVYHPLRSTSLKLLYGEAFRAPGMYEIHYADQWYSANLDLETEKIRTSELVWEQRLTPRLTFTLSIYHYSLRQLIDQVETADGMIQHQNVDNATANGLELQFDKRFYRGITSYASYVYQHAEDSRSHRTLTNQPAHVLKAGFRAPLRGRSSISPQVRYESSRRTVWDTTTDGFLLVDLRGTVGLAKHLGLSVTVRNLLNTSYSTPGGWEHLLRSIPQDGRTLILGIDYRP